MKNFTAVFIVFVLLATLSSFASGGTFTSVNSGGRWDIGSTWVGGVAPGPTDDAVIVGTGTVYLAADAQIQNCTVQSSTAELDAGGHTLTVTGDLSNAGTLVGCESGENTAGVYAISGNLTNTGTIQVGGGGGSLTLGFLGSSAQSVNGTPVVFQINGISVNNSAGVTLNSDVEIYSGTLSLLNGTLNNGAHLIFDASENIVRSAGTLGTAPTFVAGINVTYTGNVTTANELPTDAFDLGDLTINTSGTVTLSASITVNGALTFTSGKLATSSHSVTLAPTKTIIGETAGNYLVGTLITTQSVGSGSSTLGGIGVSLDAGVDNLGNVTVTRISGSGGAVTSAGKTGINRKWIISSDTPPTSGRTLSLSWISDDDNGKNLTTAGMWRSTNGGTTWGAVGAPTDASSSRTVSASVTQFGQFTVSDASDLLPVELTSFTVTPSDGKVLIAWNTATETNNSGFEVERGTASGTQSTVSDWSKIGFVDGHGTTNTPQTYSFTDATARIGKYSYRLKQIDRDGKFVYHQAVEVSVGISPSTVFLDNNYPNPFNPSTKISFVLGTSGRATLKVFNILGQEVATLADGNFSAGDLQEVTFDASRLSSGVYFYQLRTATRTEIKRMLLMK